MQSTAKAAAPTKHVTPTRYVAPHQLTEPAWADDGQFSPVDRFDLGPAWVMPVSVSIFALVGLLFMVALTFLA